jgi:hypothetical protein
MMIPNLEQGIPSWNFTRLVIGSCSPHFFQTPSIGRFPNSFASSKHSQIASSRHPNSSHLIDPRKYMTSLSPSARHTNENSTGSTSSKKASKQSSNQACTSRKQKTYNQKPTQEPTRAHIKAKPQNVKSSQLKRRRKNARNAHTSLSTQS